MNWLDQKILAMEIAQVELEAQGYDPKKARKAVQVWHQSETALCEWIQRNELTPCVWSNTDAWWSAYAFFQPVGKYGPMELATKSRILLISWEPLMKRVKIHVREFVEFSIYAGIIPKIPPHKVQRHNRK